VNYIECHEILIEVTNLIQEKIDLYGYTSGESRELRRVLIDLRIDVNDIKRRINYHVCIERRERSRFVS